MTPVKRLTQLLALTLTLAFISVPVRSYAQSLDKPENGTTDLNAPSEPTPIQELAPNDEETAVPGTEPLYDKGVTVTEIDITGNKHVPADTILKAMGTRPGSLYSRRHLQSDLKKIYDMGYFTEHIRVVPIATRNGVHLRYEVEENPIVKAVHFSGDTVLKEEDLQKIFATQIGMPQNVNIINKGIQSVEQKYRDKGYVLARVEDIQENPPGTIDLTITEGKVHKVSFTGNKKTKDYVLKRAMAQKAGEIYNEKTVAEDMKRLFSTQYFSDVRRVVRASQDAPGEYDLVIEVDEKKTAAISLGGGIDTGTGLFGSVGFSNPNFLGRGDSISTVFTEGTGVLTSANYLVHHAVTEFQSNFSNPSVAETNNALGVSLYARELASFNVPLALEQRIGTGVTWSRPIESITGVSASTGLTFENIRVREGTTADVLSQYNITPTERATQLGHASYVYIDPNLTYDSRDNRFNPSLGWLNSIGPRFAEGINNSSYGTISANIRRYLKVTDNLTLALNAQYADRFMGTIPDFNTFRLGGAYTVRGFNEGGVGTGQGFMLGSAELRAKIPFLRYITQLPLYDMISLAAFVDYGTLFDRSSTNAVFGQPGYAASAGIGIRLTIPALGPIRLDYGIPFTGNKGSNNVDHFNFGVGQKF